MYAIDLISKLTDKFEYLKYFTPYEYINAVTIVNHAKIEIIYLFISIVMIVISFGLAWFSIGKRIP